MIFSLIDSDITTLIDRVLPYTSTSNGSVTFQELIKPELTYLERTFLEQSGFWTMDKGYSLSHSDEVQSASSHQMRATRVMILQHRQAVPDFMQQRAQNPQRGSGKTQNRQNPSGSAQKTKSAPLKSADNLFDIHRQGATKS